MADVRMVFRIDGDSTPLVRAIQAAVKGASKEAKSGGKTAGDAFGREFGSQVKSAVMSFIGAGAIIGAVRSQIANARKLVSDAAKEDVGVEAMKELQRAAELTGLSVKEIRSAAPELAGAFEKLMGDIRASGGILNESTVNTLMEAGISFEIFSARMAPVLATIANGIGGGIDAAINYGSKVYGGAIKTAGERLNDPDAVRMGQLMIENAERDASDRANMPDLAQSALDFRKKRREQIEKSRQLRDSTVSALSHFRTVGGQQELSAIGMIPGGTAEMVKALNTAVEKLSSMDRTLKEGL